MTYELLIRNLPALLAAVFVAILFIQSGLDKVFDWKGNFSFITDHFSKTFLAPIVPIMFATITLMEVVTGFLSAAGVIYFFTTGSTIVIFYSAVFGALSITALFLGQRIAKDYPGAAILVPYFVLLLLLMILSSPIPSTR